MLGGAVRTQACCVFPLASERSGCLPAHSSRCACPARLRAPGSPASSLIARSLVPAVRLASGRPEAMFTASSLSPKTPARPSARRGASSSLLSQGAGACPSARGGSLGSPSPLLGPAEVRGGVARTEACRARPARLGTRPFLVIPPAFLGRCCWRPVRCRAFWHAGGWRVRLKWFAGECRDAPGVIVDVPPRWAYGANAGGSEPFFPARTPRV